VDGSPIEMTRFETKQTRACTVMPVKFQGKNYSRAIATNFSWQKKENENSQDSVG